MEVRPNDQLSFTVPNEQIIEWRRQMHAHPELSFDGLTLLFVTSGGELHRSTRSCE